MGEPQFVEDDDAALEEALAAAKQLEGAETAEILSDVLLHVLLVCTALMVLLVLCVIMAWRRHRDGLSRLYEWDATAFNGVDHDWLRSVPVHFFEYGANKKRPDPLFGTPGTWAQGLASHHRRFHQHKSLRKGSRERVAADDHNVGLDRATPQLQQQSRSTPSTPRCAMPDWAAHEQSGSKQEAGAGASSARPRSGSGSHAELRRRIDRPPAASPADAAALLSAPTLQLRPPASRGKGAGAGAGGAPGSVAQGVLPRTSSLRPPALTVPRAQDEAKKCAAEEGKKSV
eukprot:g2854.t1